MHAREALRFSLAGGACFAFAIVACVPARDAADLPREPTSQTTTTGASFYLPTGENVGTPASELDDAYLPGPRIANAACERHRECDAIGEGKPYASAQSCLTSQKRRATAELDHARCPRGLDDARLNACVAAVRTAACDDLASLSRISACARDVLCARDAR